MLTILFSFANVVVSVDVAVKNIVAFVVVIFIYTGANLN